MRYSTPGMSRKRNFYWFYLLFFMKRMNLFYGRIPKKWV
ncbi:hypothetical protein LINPERPRIM_LOCUS44558, partial [Linum perenne]